MRVLVFIGSLEQGGAERQAAELVKHLDRGRYEVSLALCNATDHLGYDLDLARRVDLRAPSGPDPAMFPRLVAAVRSLRPHVVHSWLGHQNLYGRLAVALTRTGRALSSVRCTNLPAQTIRHERWTRGLCDGWIVNSRAIRDELADRAGVDPSRVTVIENGVDTDRFAPPSPAAREAARARFGMRGPTVVLPGRIAAQKNQVALVSAVARLRDAGALPDGFRVLLAGREEASSRYGEALDAALREAGLGETFARIGVVADVESLLGAADIVALPSRYEGLPNAVLEAMACGAPCLVAPGANADALVDDGRTGWCASTAEGDALAEALRRALEAGDARRSEMGAAAREEAVARFGLGAMVRRTEAAYEALLARTPARSPVAP